MSLIGTQWPAERKHSLISQPVQPPESRRPDRGSEESTRSSEPQIDSVPAEQETVRQELSGAEQLVDTAKGDIQEIEKTINTIQMDISDASTKINDLQRKSIEVKKNDEYRALLNEVEFCEKKVSLHEDRELEFMEKLETAKLERSAADKEHDAVACLLEVSHHPQVYSMADMQERRGDVHTVLDTQRPCCRELLVELRGRKDLFGRALQVAGIDLTEFPGLHATRRSAP